MHLRVDEAEVALALGGGRVAVGVAILGALEVLVGGGLGQLVEGAEEPVAPLLALGLAGRGAGLGVGSGFTPGKATAAREGGGVAAVGVGGAATFWGGGGACSLRGSSFWSRGLPRRTSVARMGF